MEKASKEKPLISVIVPVYNVEKYINRCIDSIINQTYKNLEIILVDDGSPDNCGKICDEYALKDKRIKVIHKKNGGVGLARNIGIKYASGSYISFVDSDDWLEITFFEYMLNALVEGASDIIQCSYNRVSSQKSKSIVLNKRKYLKDEFLVAILHPQTSLGFCHMKIYDRKILHDIYFDEKLLVGEDALFNEHVAYKNPKVITIPDVLYNYRVRHDSVTKSFDENYVEKYLNSMKINAQYILGNYDDNCIEQSLYNYIAFHVLLIAVNYCFNKYNKHGISSMKRVCKNDIFKTAIRRSNYDYLSITHKISLFTVKHKLYWITKMICNIRQYQNRDWR